MRQNNVAYTLVAKTAANIDPKNGDILIAVMIFISTPASSAFE